MYIIILEGKGSSGKTTTLHMVYAVLKLINAKVERKPKCINKKDFDSVLKFKNKKVAIYTQGDIQRDCKDAIDYYANLKVDVLIIAHNSNLSPLNTDPDNTVIVKKTVTHNIFEEMSSNIGDCLNIIIQCTQHCLIPLKVKKQV